MHAGFTSSWRPGLVAAGFVALAALAACGTPPASVDALAKHAHELPLAPEGASGWGAQPGWFFPHQAVAAANPLAAEAGAQLLREGGSAIDAAVAVQMVLGLVEPQSSGIGGGGFLLLWDGHQVEAWDGRETAPAAADERLFLKPDGQPMRMAEAVPGGRAVGVPGVLRMLEAAHRAHGRLPWARLFQPAIDLAERGFALTPRPHALLAEATVAKRDPAARAFYYQPGPPEADPQPWPVGHLLRNPALAEIYRQLAARGSEAFYRGPIAADLVRRVRSHPTNPGLLTEADLAAYTPIRREAICTDWHQRWRVCGVPPPSSGHLAMMQILGLLDDLPPLPAGTPAFADGVPQPAFLHRYAEASRLAFADRAMYVGDPAFVTPPAGDWRSLLAPAYLAQRAQQIGPRAASGSVLAGAPGGLQSAWAPQAAQPEHGTSHISIVDAQGQALAFTTTVEASFGTGLLADGGTGLPGGYILNNQLTDFSFAPADAQGRPVANRVQPGKRPRSSMSPTLVFDREAGGQLALSTGSAGGAAIIHFTAKMLLGTLDWGLSAQQAANLPNFGNYNGPTVLEAGRFPLTTADALSALGHRVQQADQTSGVQVLKRQGPGWDGGADPRREGAARGD